MYNYLILKSFNQKSQNRHQAMLNFPSLFRAFLGAENNLYGGQLMKCFYISIGYMKKRYVKFSVILSCLALVRLKYPVKLRGYLNEYIEHPGVKEFRFCPSVSFSDYLKGLLMVKG